MPPPEERASNHCVYVVSCLLFVAIIGGGIFLMLYITVPDSEETAWFLIAGLLLVCTPWLFWTVTCLYRTVSMRIAAHGVGAVPSAASRTASAAPAAAGGTATATNGEQATVDSPGVVRLGAPQGGPGGGGGGKGGEEAGDYHGDCSSHISHESELPLFAKA